MAEYRELEDDEDDDDLTPAPEAPGEDSSVIRNMRKQLRDANKALKEANEFREKTEQENRKAASLAIVLSLGLNAAWAEDLPSRVDLTREAVQEWAVSRGLLAPAPVTEEDAAPAPQGFVPVTAQSSVPPSGRITVEQFTLLLKTDPRSAQDAFARGLVDGLPDLNDKGTFTVPL